MFDSLKKRQREERSNYPESLGLRVHRALSWLNRSERADDIDAKFVFLWISFNAAYANEFLEVARLSERKSFNNFISKLVDLDNKGKLHSLVWDNFSNSIRILLDNPYISSDFWEMQSGNIAKAEFELRFQADKKRALMSLASGNTSSVLVHVLARIYMLRNQVFHGGSTWNGGVNREQLRDATRLMEVLVPIIISIMMDHPNSLWGDPIYPVVKF